MSPTRLVIGENQGRRQRPLATRRRARVAWSRLTVIAAALILFCGGMGFLGHWLVTDKLFTIDRIESGPYRYTTSSRLEEKLAAVLGQNIWKCSASNLTDSLRTLPWVRGSRVRRILPATLQIEIIEWQPLLSVVAANGKQTPADQDLVLLGDGTVVPFPQDLVPPSLPVFVTDSLARGEDGSWRLAGSDAGVLMELVTAIEETGLEAVDPVDFILPEKNGFNIVLQGRRGSLLVGQRDFKDRLHGYLLARDKVEAGSEVDLRFNDRITQRQPQGGHHQRQRG